MNIDLRPMLSSKITTYSKNSCGLVVVFCVSPVPTHHKEVRKVQLVCNIIDIGWFTLKAEFVP
jgi:hypothetical protein